MSLGLRRNLLPVLAGLSLAACSVGPDYHRPTVEIPPDWGWKRAEPADTAVKGNWWELFHDPILDSLETEAEAANQTLKAAVARVDKSRADARLSASKFFPDISFDPSLTRFRTPPSEVPPDFTATESTVAVDLSYEIDVWGKVRRAFESAGNQAQADVASYYNVLLTLHGDVAVDYFLLRQLDRQVSLLNQTADLRQKAVELTSDRVKVGLAPEADLDRAQTDFSETRADAAEAQRQRDQLQDSLAVLCGQPTPDFHIAPALTSSPLPEIPVGLPSSLLERRPDVSAAERKMAAANAKIGVAYAAFFPAISLTGQAGYSTLQASSLLNWESRLFSIGPEVALPIFNGGLNEAQLKDARADYNETCADYRQQVLDAFRDVSDAVVDLDLYADQAHSLTDAVRTARETTSASRQSYQEGLVNYLEVVTAEQTELRTEIRLIQVESLQRVSTVRLIKALGGGYQAPPADGGGTPPPAPPTK